MYMYTETCIKWPLTGQKLFSNCAQSFLKAYGFNYINRLIVSVCIHVTVTVTAVYPALEHPQKSASDHAPVSYQTYLHLYVQVIGSTVHLHVYNLI